MAAHDHRDYIPGCFRCDLSRVEVTGATISRDVADASIRRGLADVAAGRVSRHDDLIEGEDVD